MFTLLHLLFGCIAVTAAFHQRYDHVAVFVVAAAILDFMDGFVARLLNATSAFGKELDSIADVVTFGVVPGMVLFNLMLESRDPMLQSRVLFTGLKYLMFIVPLFSALRLARFNTDPRQKDYFIGLPVPANALWIICLPFIIGDNPHGFHPFILAGLAMISAWLLVSEIPMMSFKMKSLSPKTYRGQYLLVIGSILLIVSVRFLAAPLVLAWYILLSLLFPPGKIKSA